MYYISGWLTYGTHLYFGLYYLSGLAGADLFWGLYWFYNVWTMFRSSFYFNTYDEGLFF